MKRFKFMSLRLLVLFMVATSWTAINAQPSVQNKTFAPEATPSGGSSVAAAQPASGKIVVTGRVTDSNGEPLVGASITSGTQGTVTDIDGNYSISLSGPTTLTYRYVGNCSLAIGLELDLYSSTHSQAVYQTTTELETQFFYARRQEKVQGTFLFCAKVFKENKINLLGKLAEMYPEPSVIPFFGRTTVAAPSALTSLKADGKKLTWESKGNGMRYVVYRIDVKQAHTLDIVSAPGYEVSGSGYYAVSVLNADNIESQIAIVKVS